MTNTRSPDRAFVATAALVFMASAAVTIAWCGSMSAMPGMEMPGGWTMSMAWMRMPGQSWAGAAATFIGMWIVMMIAMMLPALAPMLMRYRERQHRTSSPRLAVLTTIAGAGYFAVWTLCGLLAYPLGLGLAEIAMRVPAVARAVPIATGLVVMIAGILQFTDWKKRQLDCCRAAPRRAMAADAGTAWRHGLQLGLHCLHCCAGLTVVLLVIGVMDLRAMAVVAAAVTAERLSPAGERKAQACGGIAITAGLSYICALLMRMTVC